MEEKFSIVISKFGKKIELSPKVWQEKILIEHPEFGLNPEYLNEVFKAVENPEYIVEGWQGEYLALRWCEIAPKSPKYLCVVYRELEERGFIITAFFISRYGKLLRREIKWQKQPL
ncbi:MAG: hypothetical protein KKC11_05135 [Candidatus Omnitrophica bacterium]|nr:hypothetical protein [Candidatus Omnitrophota bacterium]MBU0878363.1 hypothetical protein [Candidatus Omnitrophota bacterium]MBU1134486.1 hypothetical protein [Candidatus Omnitrophota bacterium]